MKKSKLIFLIIIIPFLFASCGRETEDSSDSTAPPKPAPQLAPQVPAEEPHPAEPEAQPKTPEVPAEPESVFRTETEPAPALQPKPASPSSQPKPAAVTETGPTSEPIAEPAQIVETRRQAPEPEPEPTPIPRPVIAEAPVLLAAAAPERISWEAPPAVREGITISVTSPETVSYYQSSTSVKGFLTGFTGKADFKWELAGTQQNGELKLNSNERFSFKVNTTGRSGTLKLRMTASKDDSRTAEQILLLVNDGRGPAITLDRHAQDMFFDSSFKLSGRITNSAADSGTAEIKNTEISIINQFKSLPVEISKSGRFTIAADHPIFNEAPDENMILIITSEDYNSNISTEYISLITEPQQQLISLTSPKSGSLYHDEIIIEGTADGFREIFWDIPGSGLSGTVRIRNSAFAFPLKLSGVSDSLILRLTAESDGKKAQLTRTIYNARRAPEINIKQPSSGDFYRDTIHLSGSILPEGAAPDSLDLIKSLSWGTPGSDSAYSLIFFDTDGSFKLDIYSSSKEGLLPVEVVAEDYNGNIGRSLLILQDGKISPEIFLNSPRNDAFFGAFIYLTGAIADPYSGTDFAGISKAYYTISSIDNYNLEPLSGTIPLDPENGFNIQVPSAELTGRHQVTVRTEADNTNTSELTVEIVKGGSDISDFSLSSESGKLTARWRPVPGAESYTLYLTDDGSEPEAENARILRNVSTPLAIGGIKTGNLYKARIKAATEYGELWSSTEERIPVNRNTFALSAEGEFRQIKLSWKSISASNDYTVMRSDGVNDNFRIINPAVSGAAYIDKDVVFGMDYYYAVAPSGHEYSTSNVVEASILKAPEERIKELNLLSNFSPLDVDVTGNYAYVAAGDDGFRIVDLTTPEQLTVTGLLEKPESLAVKVRGDYAFLACGTKGLSVINIMDPGNPFTAGTRPTINAGDIDLKDDYVFVADGDSGIKIIDVSDTRFPVRAATINGTASTVLSIYRNILISGNSDGASVYDISTPLSPEKIADIKISDVQALSITDENCCILSKKSGLVIYDITTPESPQKVSQFSLRDPESIVINDAYAYIADGRAGLKVLNISNPAKPYVFDSFDTGTAVSVDRFGDNVIIAEKSGLSAVRTFLKGVSFVINYLKLDDKINSISIFKNWAMISGRENGLRVMDISSPAAPAEVTSEKSPSYSGPSLVSGNLLYLAVEPELVSVFDLSAFTGDRFSEKPLASYELQSTVKSITTAGNLVCITAANTGVHFFRDDAPVGIIDSADARSCIVKNRTAYITDYREGLKIYDITDSERPGNYSVIEIDGADSLTIDGSILFVSGRKGLHIFDIDIEQQPKQIGFIKTYYAENAVIRDKYLFLAEGYKGLSIYNISNPENPQLVSVCDTVYAADVVLYGEYALTTDITGLNTVKIFIPDWVN